jgi:hypothetical protein
MRALLFLFLFFAHSAHAYLPGADFVVSHAVSERAGLKSLEWSARITASADASGGNTVDSAVGSVVPVPSPAAMTASVMFRENLRVDFTTGKVRISYFSPSDEPMGMIETTLARLSPFGRFWLVVALDPDAVRVRAALGELRVPPRTNQEVRLSRIDQKVTWGWTSQGDPVAEIEFQKDEFVPLRYREGLNLDGVTVRSIAIPGATAKVPKLVEIRHRGRDRAYQFELKSIKADTPEKKEKFEASPVESSAVREWVQLVR